MQRFGDILKGMTFERSGVGPDAVPDAGDTCPLCHGAGYFRTDVPVGHPNFGRLIPCRCKLIELRRRQLEEISQFSQLGALNNCTFTNFQRKGMGMDGEQERSVQVAFRAAYEFAQQPEGWLALSGGYGCGKTHLAAAIANHRLSVNEPALFVVVPDLLGHLRAAFGPHSEISYDHFFEAVRETPLLVLDDLGAQQETPWAQEKLYQIFNHRYNLRLPTVITTNCVPEDLEPRIKSRMSDLTLCSWIEIRAPHYTGQINAPSTPRTPSRRKTLR